MEPMSREAEYRDPFWRTRCQKDRDMVGARVENARPKKLNFSSAGKMAPAEGSEQTSKLPAGPHG